MWLIVSSLSLSYYYYYNHYYYYFLIVFHISISWWSFTGIWVKTSLLMSPGLFSVFWPFSSDAAAFWLLFTRLPTFKSSSQFNNYLVTIPNAPITIGIIITFMFHSFFNFLTRPEVLILFFFTFFQFHSVVSQYSKVYNSANSLFFIFYFFCWLLWGLVSWLRLGDPSVGQSPIGVLCVSFSRTGAGLCIYHLSGMVKFKFSCTTPSGSLCLPSRV